MSQRWLAFSTYACVAAAAALSIYVAYDCWKGQAAPKFRVESADLNAGNLRPGVTAAVDFVVVNDGEDPIRLVGAGNGCGVNCCMISKLDGLPVVPPRGRTALTFELHPRKPSAEFTVSSTIYVEWHDQTWPVDVSVSGTTPAADSTAAKSPQ